MGTVPFTTIERRGCCSAQTCPGCSSTFLLGNSCFRVRESVNRPALTKTGWRVGFPECAAGCSHVLISPTRAGLGFGFCACGDSLVAVRYVGGVGLTFWGHSWQVSSHRESRRSTEIFGSDLDGIMRPTMMVWGGAACRALFLHVLYGILTAEQIPWEDQGTHAFP